MPHRCLSAPFEVHGLDLQARLAARQAASSGDAAAGSSSSSSSSIPTEGSGSGGDASTEGSAKAGSNGGCAAAWELDTEVEVAVTADGECNAIVLWMEVHAGEEPGAVVTSGGGASGSRACGSSSSGSIGSSEGSSEGGGTTPPCLPAPAVASSWEQGVQYVDVQAVKAGATVSLRVRHDAGQYVVTSKPPQCRPRHALGEKGWAGCRLPLALLPASCCMLSPAWPPNQPSPCLCAHPPTPTHTKPFPWPPPPP